MLVFFLFLISSAIYLKNTKNPRTLEIVLILTECLFCFITILYLAKNFICGKILSVFAGFDVNLNSVFKIFVVVATLLFNLIVTIFLNKKTPIKNRYLLLISFAFSLILSLTIENITVPFTYYSSLSFGGLIVALNINRLLSLKNVSSNKKIFLLGFYFSTLAAAFLMVLYFYKTATWVILITLESFIYMFSNSIV